MAVLLKGRHPAEILEAMAVARINESQAAPERTLKIGARTPYADVTPENVTPEQLAELRGKVLVAGTREGALDRARALVRLANPAIVAALSSAPAKRDMRYASHFTHWVKTHGLEDAPVVLVTGNRGFASQDTVDHMISLLAPGTIVVQGEAEGADARAAEAAIDIGLPLAGFPAQWRVQAWTPTQRIAQGPRGPYDVAAGHIRNQRMLDAVLAHPGPVVGCLAFTDDLERRSGTRDMASRAFAAGLTIVAVNEAGERRTFQPESRPEVVAAGDAPADVVAEAADVAGGPDIVTESTDQDAQVTA